MAILRLLTLIVSALVACSVPTSGSAERLDFSGLAYPAYPVEMAIQACNRNLKRDEYVVLAYSPGGALGCVYGDRELATSSRKMALDNCNQGRFAAEAKLTKCRLVMETGKVIDRNYFNTLRRDARSPVNIEIFDGPTQKVSRTTGYLSTGRMLSKTTIEGKLTTSRGAVLCKGKVLYGLSGARFEGICFDKFKFTGKVPEPSGYMMHEGQLVQRVTMKFQHKDSYIAVSPRD